MPFFEFRQNNSGGSFVIDESAGLSVSVIVEADSAKDANERAESIGIYFDGCESGRDCDCCGDRWSAAGFWGDVDGDPVPSVYGTHFTDYVLPSPGWGGNRPEAFIHPKAGPFIPLHLINGRFVHQTTPAVKEIGA